MNANKVFNIPGLNQMIMINVVDLKIFSSINKISHENSRHLFHKYKKIFEYNEKKDNENDALERFRDNWLRFLIHILITVFIYIL